MFGGRFFFFKVHVFIIFCISLTNAQYYNQNGTLLPYPYQTSLGLPLGQAPQNVGDQPVERTFVFPDLRSNLPESNGTQNFNNYYTMLAQQGRPVYQYPQGYPQAGIGYPQPVYGYPPLGVGYPQPGFGYQQPYQPVGGLGYGGYPGIVYPYQGGGAQYASYPPGQGIGQQHLGYGRVPDPYQNINSGIRDVSPEYHRQVLGWPSESTTKGTSSSTSGNNVEGSVNQGAPIVQPRYNIITDSQTSNFTSIPSNLTKPIVTTKQFTTSIRRTFVYDSSKPGETKAINLHFVNGEEVTTTPPSTTTENEDVEGSKVTPKGRRFMDVPASCPTGTLLAHNGKCITPFSFASLSKNKNDTLEATTEAPTKDLNEI